MLVRSSSSSIIVLISSKRRLLRSIRRCLFRGGTNINININESPITNNAYNIGAAITATAAVVVISLTSLYIPTFQPDAVEIDTTTTRLDNNVVGDSSSSSTILLPSSSLNFNKDTKTLLSADKDNTEEKSRKCNLSWVTESKTTMVDCHRFSKQNSNNKKDHNIKELLFDPLESHYFQIKLNETKIIAGESNTNKSGSCVADTNDDDDDDNDNDNDDDDEVNADTEERPMGDQDRTTDRVIIDTIDLSTATAVHRRISTPYISNSNGTSNINSTSSKKIQTSIIKDDGHNNQSNSYNNSSILHNTVIVLPNLMTEKECKSIVNETERILLEDETTRVGCKTEKWTLYSRYDHHSQQVIDRVLVDQVLKFIRERMPNIAKQLLIREVDNNNNNNNSETTTASTANTATTNTTTNNNNIDSSKNIMRYYWDDPVVVTYSPGNELAPHNDLRDLTIVIPLKYPPPSPLLTPSPPPQQLNNKDMILPSSSELEGNGRPDNNGTKFWTEGTSPEDAMEKIRHVLDGNSGDDDDDGIEVTPSLGSGILFNGEITHTGSAIAEGTRFVLMTSITLDEKEDYDDYEDYDDDDDDVNEDDE